MNYDQKLVYSYISNNWAIAKRSIPPSDMNDPNSVITKTEELSIVRKVIDSVWLYTLLLHNNMSYREDRNNSPYWLFDNNNLWSLMDYTAKYNRVIIIGDYEVKFKFSLMGIDYSNSSDLKNAWIEALSRGYNGSIDISMETSNNKDGYRMFATNQYYPLDSIKYSSQAAKDLALKASTFVKLTGWDNALNKNFTALNPKFTQYKLVDDGGITDPELPPVDRDINPCGYQKDPNFVFNGTAEQLAIYNYMNRIWDGCKTTVVPNDSNNQKSRIFSENELLQASKMLDAVLIYALVTTQGFYPDKDRNGKKFFWFKPENCYKILEYLKSNNDKFIIGDYLIDIGFKLDNIIYTSKDIDAFKNAIGSWKKDDSGTGYFPIIINFQICKSRDCYLLSGTNVLWDDSDIKFSSQTALDLGLASGTFLKLAGWSYTGYNRETFNPKWTKHSSPQCSTYVVEPDPENSGGGGGGSYLTIEDCPCEEIIVDKTLYLRKARLSDKDVPFSIKFKRETCKQSYTGKNYKFKCDEDLFKEIKSGGGGGGNVKVPETFSFPNNIGSLGSLQSVGRQRRIFNQIKF